MGVKELWTILSPAKKEVYLDSLTGYTIAVDLSVWICENQGVKAVQGKVSKPHLRNLFFRISNLIQLGITLVFVVDGDPPELKWETISNRINSRYKGRGRGSTKNNRIGKPGRSHFKSQIKECLELLDHLGVPYVQSKGEAEALCALLNQEGVVDGCITEDGDVFLYGAITVYRNFNLAGKNPVIDCYKMADIERQLGLTREALVALALFLGCDYVPRGVPGVGKVHALQLISQFKGSNILERFKRWANGDVDFQLSLPSKPAHCTRCHHIGSAQKHKTGGCPLCGRSSSCTAVKNGPPCTCDWHKGKEEFDKCAPERDIMLKALQVPGFPQENVIEEFLNVKDKCPRYPLKFARPKMVKIMKFALEKLDWPEKYTREKVIDLVIFHDLQNSKEDIAGGSENLDIDTIVKRRIRNGVPCVEVLWKLPDEWKLEEDESGVITTIENFDLFKSVFPDVVEEFESIEASKKEKKGKKKKTAVASSAEVTPRNDYNSLETVTDQLSALVLQNKDAHESVDTHNFLVHNTDKLSGDSSCDSTNSPKRRDGDSRKRMNDDSSKEGLCLQKERVNKVTNLNSLSDCVSSEQYDVISDDKVFTSFEGKGQLYSECGAHVVQGREDTFTQIPNSECNGQSRKDEEGGQCSVLDCTSENIGEMRDRVHQPLDDSVILSLAERLDLKMRQKVYMVDDMHKCGSDESGGTSGKRSVDLNKCKQQGKYDSLGYMEQRNSHAERVTHVNHETLQKVNSKQAGKVLSQRLKNVKGQNLSRVVLGDSVSHVSSLTSSSTMMCPELFNISTPDMSLTDGGSDCTLTQSSTGQCKMPQKGQEMASVCPEVQDVSTPNVTLLEEEGASGNTDSQDRTLEQEETSGIRDSLEKVLIGSNKVKRNIEVREDIYDLITPNASLVNSSDERNELEHILTIRPILESEKGNSPMCSGSCDVMRATKLALIQVSERESHDGKMGSRFDPEGSVPLEPTELYDLCTPDVSTVVDQNMDEVKCGEDKIQDVIEISDDDYICQDSINGCIQDSCNDLKEHLWGRGEGDGESSDGEGGQQVSPTPEPECSIWEEPTALNINTPSQTMVIGTAFTSERGNVCMEEREPWRLYSSDKLHDSYQIGNQYSQLRNSACSERLNGGERCLLGDSGRLSPSTGLDGSTMGEKSMDHSLFQKLNFSLGLSVLAFSPLSESSSTRGCGQVNQSKVNEKTDRKHLNKSDCLRQKAESVTVHKYAHAYVDSVFQDKGLEWHLDKNAIAKNGDQRTVTTGGNPLLEGEGCGGKKADKSDRKEQNGSLRKVVDKEHAGHDELLMSQPGVSKLMCNEKGEIPLSGASVNSDRGRRCDGLVGRGEGKGRGVSYKEDNGGLVLREKNNDRNRHIDTRRARVEKHQGMDEGGKDEGQSLTNEDLSMECIGNSYTSIKIQKNFSSGREIDLSMDKENSPVSLMARLRKRSARTRDILESMELE